MQWQLIMQYPAKQSEKMERLRHAVRNLFSYLIIY